MKLTRTFHPVGQGAFYAERFYKSDKNVFNMAYDCGSSTKGQYLRNEINDAFKDGTGKAEIDILFVSHFHNDHVNGIEELARQYHIKQLAIPAPKLFNKNIILVDYLHNLCKTLDLDNFPNKFLEFCFAEDGNLEYFTNTQIVPVDGKEIPIFEILWEYLPFCDIHLSAQDFVEEFIKEFLFKSVYDGFNGQNFVILYDYFKKNKNIHDLKDFYRDYFKKHYRNDNYYSMTVLSKPIIEELNDTICLYTGDYPAREESYLTNLRNHYTAYWDNINTLQAPHHGSRYDNPDSLYDNKKRNCVISYGKDNQYRHPDGEALLAIYFSGSTLHAVNEDVKTEYKKDFLY